MKLRKASSQIGTLAQTGLIIQGGNSAVGFYAVSEAELQPSGELVAGLWLSSMGIGLLDTPRERAPLSLALAVTYQRLRRKMCVSAITTLQALHRIIHNGQGECTHGSYVLFLSQEQNKQVSLRRPS